MAEAASFTIWNTRNHYGLSLGRNLLLKENTKARYDIV